jgi:hypothetical protein
MIAENKFIIVHYVGHYSLYSLGRLGPKLRIATVAVTCEGWQGAPQSQNPAQINQLEPWD